MFPINAHTKISAILRQNPAALDAIVSISPKFEKLRNPLLRKLMAGRTSIAMASKIGGCKSEDFFSKLAPLGFVRDHSTKTEETIPLTTEKPAFLEKLSPDQLVELDVRSLIAEGIDPLAPILKKLKECQPGQVLKIINSFEPTPLMLLLQKQGYQSWAERVDEETVNTYFYKTEGAKSTLPSIGGNHSVGLEEIMQQYEGRLKTIDVRTLEMPLPMTTILDELDEMEKDSALFVYHKRIPVFLLPELKERKMDFRIKEMGINEFHILIFRS